jgi:c-di-GMP phosphodiesterase Gmr
MNELFIDFLTILLPTYFFFYMAVTLIFRNKTSELHRVAAILMLAFLFYFLGEYVKTSLLPQYQMQIVLYGNGPMLLLMICSLVHLCILIGGPSPHATYLNRWLPGIYAAPYILLAYFLITKDHQVLFDASVTDGRSPLDPLFMSITLLFVLGYILLSVMILTVSWYGAKEPEKRNLLRSMLVSLFGLFAWFVFVSTFLQLGMVTARYAMIFYFIGYLLWAVSLRHMIGKHDLMPDYRKLFHILFHSAPTAILLLDRKGTIWEMNPQAKLWFEGIPTHEIRHHFHFDEGLSLDDKLALFLGDQDNQALWEIRMYNPNKGYLDLIMGLDLIENRNKEFIVMHLTNATSLKDTERKLMESESRYRYLALHDSLTELYNRMAIQEHLQNNISSGERFALILIDLDHFKPINDTYGHLVGDLYLKHIAHVLKEHSEPADFIGRFGGDEFVIVIPCPEDVGAVEQEVSRRLSSLHRSSFEHKELTLSISFSAGVSVYPRDAEDVTTLMKKADEAMYSVKRNGRNGVSVSTTGT